MLISTNSGLYSARKNAQRVPMAEAVGFFAKAGFEAVDINFCATIYEEEFRHEPILDGDWRANLDGLLAAVRQNGLVISLTHLPFYNYALPDGERLARYEEMMYRSIEAVGYIGAKYAVIHPHRDEQRTTLTEETVAFLRPFQAAAEKNGVTLCVENMVGTTPEILADIADRLGACTCWDVGHANLSGLDQASSIRTLGHRLKVLHLHDNYGTKDDHSLPFLGTVDWQGILSGLRDIGFEGAFNYEVSATALPMALRMEHARYLVKAAKLLLERP